MPNFIIDILYSLFKYTNWSRLFLRYVKITALLVDFYELPALQIQRRNNHFYRYPTAVKTPTLLSLELDDGSSTGPCEYSSSTCVACLADCRNCCPLHEVDENCGESLLSNEICRNKYCVDNTVIGKTHSFSFAVFHSSSDCTKTIELCDITRKPKLKVCDPLKRSPQRSFFWFSYNYLISIPSSLWISNKLG